MSSHKYHQGDIIQMCNPIHQRLIRRTWKGQRYIQKKVLKLTPVNNIQTYNVTEGQY